MAVGPGSVAQRAARIIAVAPVGRAAPAVVRHLHSVLEDTFGREVIDAPGLPLALRAYRPARGQWLATDLLDALAPTRAARCERILGVAEVDLFVPDLNFVFGVADAALGAALFSLARLVAPRDPQRTLRRAATEAVHELGHTYGLGHCKDPRCAMWFSNTLAETDRKGARLCARDAAALRRATALNDAD
ncbi:peptidase M54 [Anaeromyxobacter oryzae]|uniref:Peptidase n=1 Tax=Anaeromyxobacter oryzae TaxID=2918170 RepID=A0ABN6MPF2_9BACT|nr:peptidase M54 [Anaeromyxobacter oryzae]BDG02899.1 peptidase [Anaeromyxobacter oryzae]